MLEPINYLMFKATLGNIWLELPMKKLENII